MAGISNQVQAEYDGLYEDLQSSGTDALKGRYESIYDMLDDELLGSLVENGELSPEEAETLKKWSSVMAKLHQNVRTKGERILTKAQEAQMKAKRVEDAKKKYEETGKKWAAKKEAKKKGIKIASPVDDEFNDELEGLSEDELENKLRELMDSDDPDYDKMKEVAKRKKKLEKMNRSNVQENHVMGYFTEQIEKDRLTHKHGEFKDRGFKKPVNYAHWLWLNND
jgi:DNA mismatch repair ATPase MutS